MRAHRIASIAALVVAPLALSGATCVKFPTLVDRVVQLVTTQYVAVGPFTGSGNNTTWSSGNVVLDLASYVNSSQLSSYGVDVNKIVSIKVRKISYQIITANTGTATDISNGRVDITPAGGSLAQLVTGFAENITAPIGPKQPTLIPAGVDAINTILAAALADIQAGTTGVHAATFSSSGDANGTTNFQYTLSVEVEIVWKQDTKMIN